MITARRFYLTLTALLLLFVGLIYWKFANRAVSPISNPAPTVHVENINPAVPEVVPAPALPVQTGEVTVLQELEAVQFSLEDFRKSLGENPVGGNAEIIRSMRGDNPRQLQIALPAQAKFNPEGELLDRWGTPYFFHQLSKTEMEIRSAGPDRQMWNEDDVQIK
jgi:hypothetical protein